MQALKEQAPLHRWTRNVCKAGLNAGFALLPRNVTARRAGVRYRLDLRDDVQQLVFLSVYERADLKRLRQYIGPSAVCFDAGAHVGIFTIQMARLAGPSGHVFSFEPDPDNARRLTDNIAINGFGSAITVENAALGSAPGVMVFHKSEEGHSAWGSLLQYDDLNTSMLQVRVETLDDYCGRNGIGWIDFLKIDVEGFEFELLDGAAGLLKNRKVKTVLVEFNGPRQTQRGHTLKEMIDFFGGCGFELLYDREALTQIGADPQRCEAVLKNLWFGLREVPAVERATGEFAVSS